MGIFIGILILITCILLILIVLIQNSKGGGLASNFSSSGQVMGVRKTADFLEKSTWTLAGVLLLLSLISAAFNSGQKNVTTVQETELKEHIDRMVPSSPSNFGQENSPNPDNSPEEE